MTHLSGEMSTHKMFLQQHNLLSCAPEQNQPGEDKTQCCSNGMISIGDNKPISLY